MKFNLLINSINQSLFRDFFTNLPDDFSCISTSNLWDDIKGHFKIFEPDAFVCVVEDDVSVYKSIFKNIKGSLIFSKIPIIVITVDEIYKSFSMDDMEYMDLVLCRPITIANIYFKIQSFIEDKRAEEERICKEQEAERIRKEQEVEELAKSALKNEKKNILVVDDDKNVLRILKSRLDDKYTVTTMISGKMAEKYLEQRSCDLILLDYQMPGETGPEVFAKIKEIESAKDIPIVFLTGVADKEKIAEVLRLKPQGYLLKPIDTERLFTTIERVMEGAE